MKKSKIFKSNDSNELHDHARYTLLNAQFHLQEKMKEIEKRLIAHNFESCDSEFDSNNKMIVEGYDAQYDLNEWRKIYTEISLLRALSMKVYNETHYERADFEKMYEYETHTTQIITLIREKNKSVVEQLNEI